MHNVDDKRNRILDAAMDHFARHPFHKVLLDDVARTAAVGKGTLYLYFQNKEDLYFSVLLREFCKLVDALRSGLADRPGSPREELTFVVREMVRLVFGHSIITEILRGSVVNCPHAGIWKEKRRELHGIIESVIRRGIDAGDFEDSAPELTALYILGIIRFASRYRPKGTAMATVQEHALAFVLNGLARKG